MTAIPELSSLDDIATEVCDAFGDVSQLSRDKAYRKINRALRIISRKGSWPFFNVEDETITTVSGTETYNLKARTKLPRFVHMRDPARKLTMVDLRTLRRLYPNNTDTTGAPMYWRIVNFDKDAGRHEIALWPVPDGVYTLYVDAEVNPTLMTDKNDDIRSTGLPEEMIETVIDLAIALMYEASADIYEQKMGQAMAKLDDDYYRLGVHPDDNMDARTYSGSTGVGGQDPILDPSRFNDL